MELQFETESMRMHKEMKRGVVAAVETGNFDRARLLLTEYQDIAPDLAEGLRMEIIHAYGTSL
jgi:hypothetical protein